MSPVLVRSLAAEFIGTALLVFVAVGSAVAGIKTVGEFGVALGYPADGEPGIFLDDYRRATRRARAVVERVFYGW